MRSGGSDGKESAGNAGNLGLIPRLARSPGEGHGYPLQHSCLGNPIDRGAWQATVLGVAESRAQQVPNSTLSLFTSQFQARASTASSRSLCVVPSRSFLIENSHCNNLYILMYVIKNDYSIWS